VQGSRVSDGHRTTDGNRYAPLKIAEGVPATLHFRLRDR